MKSNYEFKYVEQDCVFVTCSEYKYRLMLVDMHKYVAIVCVDICAGIGRTPSPLLLHTVKSSLNNLIKDIKIGKYNNLFEDPEQNKSNITIPTSDCLSLIDVSLNMLRKHYDKRI